MEPSVKGKPETIHVMEERHSVRAYLSGEAMPKADLDMILKAAGSAPSSWNLQHWKFLVIEDAAQREKLLPIAYGQRQITESSVVVAVLGDLEANRNAEAVYEGMKPEIKDTLLGQIHGAYQNKAFARDEAFLNGGFAGMQLMLAAKALGYDTCPMGGYNRAAFIEAFQVPERYVPLMLVTIGKAAKPAHATSRFSLDEIVVKETY
jgi:nitroreductase